MNKRQKDLLRDLASIIVITAIAVIAMINFKDWVKRTEAKRAMEQLGQIVLQYRKDHGSVPPEPYVDRIKENLPGHVRLSKFRYRARWLDFESIPDEILAYTVEAYHSLLFNKRFLVLRLDGRVEWMNKHELEILLAQQQTPMEIETLNK
jgi:hypothetical protein